jgi:uncharacterized membrane protein
MNKKASFFENWPEYFFILLLLLGIIISLIVKQVWISYLIIAMSGLITGRIFYNDRHKQIFIVYFITFAYFVGYLIGNHYGLKANWAILLMFFVAGNLLSYRFHRKGYIK